MGAMVLHNCMQSPSPSPGRGCAGGDGEGYGAYYRSERTRALDEHFGDMLHKIHDLEARQLAAVFQHHAIYMLFRACAAVGGFQILDPPVQVLLQFGHVAQHAP